MNTIPCPDCDQAVSVRANNCPACGAPGPARLRRRKVAGRIAFTIALLAILWAAVAIYRARVAALTESYGGFEMPDVSTRKH